VAAASGQLKNDNQKSCTLYQCCIAVLFCCCNTASSEDSDTDSTDSTDSESPSSNNKTQDTAAVEQLTRVLSDQELNQLGAKILRAEMMGDEVHFF